MEHYKCIPKDQTQNITCKLAFELKYKSQSSKFVKSHSIFLINLQFLVLFRLKKYTTKVLKKQTVFSLGELEPVTSYNSERFAHPVDPPCAPHGFAGFGSGALARKNYEVPLEDNDPGAKEPVRNLIAKPCERVRINNALKPHLYPTMTHNMTIHHASKHTEFQSW